MSEVKTLPTPSWMSCAMRTKTRRNQLTKALPTMAETATSAALRAAFEAHFEETRGHVARSREHVRRSEQRCMGSTATASRAVSKEGASSGVEEDFDDATMDACLIAFISEPSGIRSRPLADLIAWARADGP